MQLCHYLTPNNIVILGKERSASKDDILKELVMDLAKLNNIKHADHLAQSILDREREGSTFLPTGIAIPHARVPDVDEITLIMGVIPDGFREAEGSDPTYLVILFLSPIKDKEFGRHLKLLARISSSFRDPEFVRKVASLNDVDRIFSAIQQKERETAE